MIQHDFAGIYDPSGYFLPEDNNIFNMILLFAEKARREGLVSLEDDLELIDNAVMKLAMELVINLADDTFYEDTIQEKITALLDNLETLLSCVKFTLCHLGEENFTVRFDNYVKSNAVSLHNNLHYDIVNELVNILADGRVPQGASGKYTAIIEKAIANKGSGIPENLYDEDFTLIIENNRKFYRAVKEGVLRILCGDTEREISVLMQSIIGRQHYDGMVRDGADFSGWMVAPQCTFAGSFSEGIAIISRDEEYGLVNRNGRVFWFPHYEELMYGGDGMVPFKYRGKWGVLGDEGNVILDAEYDGIGWSFYHNRMDVEKDGVPGFIDSHGRALFQPESSDDEDRHDCEISGNSRMKITPQLKDGKYGFVDSQGTFIISPRFDKIRWLFKDHVAVIENGMWGCVRADGVIIIEPVYEWVGAFEEGLCCVKDQGKFGYVDEDGKLVIKPRFDDVGSFSAGVVCVKVNGKWGFCNDKGDFIIEPEFEWIEFKFRDGLARMKKGGFYGVISSDGTYRVSPRFKKLWDFQNDLARIEMNGKYGFLDRSGEIAVDPIYEWVRNFYEGAALVKREGRWGYIDMKGNHLTEFCFDDGGDVSEGIAAVSVNGKWGYINLLIQK